MLDLDVHGREVLVRRQIRMVHEHGTLQLLRSQLTSYIHVIDLFLKYSVD